MKRNLLFWLCSLLIQLPVQAQKPNHIELNGTFQGEDLYIRAQFSPTEKSCIQQIRVNDSVLSFDKTASALKIPLTQLGFKTGDELFIRIDHLSDCRPKVLNQDLGCGVRVHWESTSIDTAGLILWQVNQETLAGNFYIEQYQWGKWVQLAEVEASERSNSYELSYKIMPHSGINKFRIKFIDFTGIPSYSKETEIASDRGIPKVKHGSPVKFTSATTFELFDEQGVIVQRGYGMEVQWKALSPGVYYLRYDRDQVIQMKKKQDGQINALPSKN